MKAGVSYRLRLRVRLAKALNTPDISRTFEISGREVTIVSQQRDEPLSEAYWIVLKARGFRSEEEARVFGEQLRTMISLAGVCCRLGIDVGQDQQTGWVSEDFAKSAGLIQSHERIMPTVHGLVVFPDDERTRFFLVQASGRVLADAEAFIEALRELAGGLPRELTSATEAVRIMNLALLSSQPQAQIALCLSAVEALGQDEKWTDAQTVLISSLAAQVERNADVAEVERREVAEAIRRGLHRIGLRQGVMRILDKLDLRHLRKEWDRVYGLRSGLFHGTVSLSEPEIGQLAFDAVGLCGKIILALCEKNGATLPAISAVHFARS